VTRAGRGLRSPSALLVSGHFLPLSTHPRADWNDLWLLTRIEHQGKQPQVLEESITSHSDTDDGFTQGYRNRLTATPWDVPFRPALQHPKAKILGSQTAKVTGPAGEEIHYDQYGRVKVQFHWDRDGQADDHSSCWLRVQHEGHARQHRAMVATLAARAVGQTQRRLD
jgi:type VI secretion system secreted protein VgrG